MTGAARRTPLGGTALAAAALLVACGGGDGAAGTADEKPAASASPATVVSLPPTSTRESIIGSTVTTLPPSTTVTVRVGLPDGLGIPGAGMLTLGSSSTLSHGLTVRGVPVDEVVAFVRDDLAALGWTVFPDLTFAGPGAVGRATVAQVGEDVEIQLLLSGPAG